MDAIDDLGDALETTRGLLTPPRPGLWLRLALVVLFVSSFGVGGLFVPGVDPGYPGELDMGHFEYEDDVLAQEEVLAAIVVGLVVALLGWLLYTFVASVMEYVFVDALRSTELSLRRTIREYLGLGSRLFLFRLGLVLAVVALGAVPTVLGVLLTGTAFPVTVAGGVLFGLYVLAVGLAFAVVRRLTAEFVVAVSLHEDRGILVAWRRFLPVARTHWREYGVYLLVVWILGLVASIGAWLVAGLAIGAVALVLGVVAVLFGAVLGGATALTVALVLLGVVLGVLIAALVWTPVTVYFRYYALLLLGDTDVDLDLLPDQRAAARAGGWRSDSSAGDEGWTGSGDSDDRWSDDATDDGWDEDGSDEGWTTGSGDDGSDANGTGEGRRDDEFQWNESDDGSDSSRE